MNANLIRKWSLSGKNQEMKDLMISGKALNIYHYAKNESKTTASIVSCIFDISIQHASGILSKLESQGYLSKMEIPQESGGYEWVYSIA